MITTIAVPSGDLVTSFSSKSEGALNLSTNGQDLTFMGYIAPVGAIDVSNSNTPWVVDPTNPVPGTYYRAVAQLDRSGQFQFTKTNAYSGNNGRAAILNNADDVFYTAGNAGNGGNPQPPGIVLGAGAQIIKPTVEPQSGINSRRQPTPVGNFNVTELGDKADKIGKDDNFRGMTIYNNVLYYTKGSGGNGVNTVYFVDTTGNACPNGVGLPAPGAPLPTSPLDFDANAATRPPGQPANMCVLKGFNTRWPRATTALPVRHLVRQPGHAVRGRRGRRRHTFDATTADTDGPARRRDCRSGCSTAPSVAPRLHAPVGAEPRPAVHRSGIPDRQQPRDRPALGPATDGLRNITGQVNRDGTATIYAVTSTVSGSGDQGADPNQVVGSPTTSRPRPRPPMRGSRP